MSESAHTLAFVADERFRPAPLEALRNRVRIGRRGWLVRRLLLCADVVGLGLALMTARLILGPEAAGDGTGPLLAAFLFMLLFPLWVVAAKIAGLYDRDEERIDPSTADDLSGVFLVATVGVWLVAALTVATGVADPDLRRLVVFWLTAVVFVSTARVAARAFCRRHPGYVQRTLIVGAGPVAQLLARKVLHHKEYGLKLVGFVDDHKCAMRSDLGGLSVLGGLNRVRDVVVHHEIERVIVAFTHEPNHEPLNRLLRSLSSLDVQIDLVPRLYEIVGPNASMHMLEGVPLMGLPPVRLSRSSLLLKRTLDVVVGAALLVLAAPLMLAIAVLVKRDSEGPVLFRQRRLGFNMREFTTLKFRTMKVGTSDAEHREFIRELSNVAALPSSNGLYKLDRADAVTRVGKWLRRTSLDELPQLINVLRGDMSLVGPRPCLGYEVETFEPHHFERFLVPQGVTGLWQVHGRAHTTFREALDMDVAYARAWTLGLDVRLLLRTPLQLLRPAGTR